MEKKENHYLCTKSWVYILNKLVDFINKSKNITILKNTKIINIKIRNINEIKTNKKTYYSKKVLIPSYGKIKNIIYFDKIINLPYEIIKNKHFILYLKTDKHLLKKNFNGFYEKKPTGCFDRVSIFYTGFKNEDVNLIIITRITKEFKNKKIDNTGEIYLNFLKSKKIISTNCKFIKLFINIYECVYRNIDLRNKITEEFKNLKNIEYTHTHYIGHFLANLINI